MVLEYKVEGLQVMLALLLADPQGHRTSHGKRQECFSV
jgi:hypothetical protein